MGNEDLPGRVVAYPTLIRDIDHTIEVRLILIVNVELVSMAQDRVAHILLTWEEELRRAVFTIRGKVVFFTCRTTVCREEDVLARLRFTHATGEAHVFFLIDQRGLSVRQSLGKGLRRAKCLIDQCIVERLAVLSPR